MHVKAVIEQGEVKLLTPINLKHDKVNIELIIPDNEVISSEQTRKIDKDDPYKQFSPEIQKMMREIDEIRNQPIDDSVVPELTEKQKARIKAFEFRHQLRKEQGRID
jgi:hypothetical protein